MRHIVLCTLMFTTLGIVGGCASLGEKPEQMIAAAGQSQSQPVSTFSK
jgi:hypothetical protein